MAEYALVSGRWVKPVLETVADVVTMHVSIGVDSEEELARADVEATLVAGGQVLEQTFGAAHQGLSYLVTGSTTAIADFAWANPEQLTPESVDVRVRDETVTFDLLGGGDLPIA